jgi:ABC transporter substrate binding protein
LSIIAGQPHHLAIEVRNLPPDSLACFEQRLYRGSELWPSLGQLGGAHGKYVHLCLADDEPVLAHERALVAKLMVEHRLPSIYAYHEHVVVGGLMAFMTDYYDIFRREAAFIDKIVKGAKPVDLPVGEPTKFELVINLKTAKALGLDVRHRYSCALIG